MQAGRGAFRGLALTFALSLLNLVGVLVTAAALGGVEPWTRWQFVGLYGVVEVASGLANIVAPNIWRLPVDELETGTRTRVQLAASTLLVPHWGGLARCAAGVVLVGLAGWQEGVGAATPALVPFVLALGIVMLAVSAILGRAGVARPELDVVAFGVRWGRREKALAPISVTASVFQFLLSIVTIPAAKALPPSMLFQPELGPSTRALGVALGAAGAFSVAAALTWSGRMSMVAPREQQRAAEEG